MARFHTAKQIINRVAAEVGLDEAADPLGSTDKNMIRLKHLLNTAGADLVMLNPWAILRMEATITTDGSESYDLPSDFAYKTDQTGWNRTDDLPLAGPLTAQEWSFILGRGLGASTLYASFRMMGDQVFILPTSLENGTDIRYEYTSRNWVSASATSTPAPAADEVTTNTQAPLFEPLIIQRYLKLKFLDSTGADTRSAQADFDQVFQFWTSKDKGAKVLSVARTQKYPYLDPYRNTPDTNFGL